ncbi:hypothetical protein G7067_00720 [Leucobacter insecticola]|uniref:Uncharacterized protein n=1 Tax=Leucobacter insecticola TaxID=2714934 RepID=A0A6G8FG97_9MICO|nr:hypothetical protein [Leucobacter insecticola]QIM15273.1 hypothetical protein G7067_00720 [Leucobacter insecticola]
MKDLPEGRANPTDQFMLTIDGGGLASGNVGTTTGREPGMQDRDFNAYAGPVAVKPGETYTLSELGVNGAQEEDYASRWSCKQGEEEIAHGRGVEGSVTIPESPANGTDVACTFTNAIVGGLSASKSAVPASGTPVQANDTITYTLRFANSASTPATVDTTDDLSDVLGNATMIQDPVSSSGTLAVVRTGKKLAITGALAAKSTATVSYTVRVHEKSERASNTVTNTLQGCASPEDCTTEHPVAALGVEKSAEAEIGVVNYTVTVTNTGEIAYTADKPATMTDNLAGLVKVGAVYRGTCGQARGRRAW